MTSIIVGPHSANVVRRVSVGEKNGKEGELCSDNVGGGGVMWHYAVEVGQTTWIYYVCADSIGGV